MQERGLRIGINIPAHDHCSTLFAYDLARMTGFTGGTVVADGTVESVGINMVTATYIHSARQQLAEHALAAGCDYLLWLDSDMRFPKDALMRLLAHNEPVVGINYSSRGTPPKYVALKKVGTDPENPGQPCPTTPESSGLEEVEALGGGAMLVRADVYHALPDPAEGPWYWYEWIDSLGQQVGEDVYFCNLVREAGFPIYVDHDLSKECAHVGTFEYRLDEVSMLGEIMAEEERPKLEVVRS